MNLKEEALRWDPSLTLMFQSIACHVTNNDEVQVTSTGQALGGSPHAERQVKGKKTQRKPAPYFFLVFIISDPSDHVIRFMTKIISLGNRTFRSRCVHFYGEHGWTCVSMELE